MSQPKWLPAELGAEPKKVGALVVLLAVLGYVFFFTGDDAPPMASTPAANTTAATNVAPASPAGAAAGQRVVQTPPARRVRRRAGGDEGFEPTLLLEEDFDVSQVDPTLRLALLDRVRSVGNVGGRRSLFEFFTPPPPPPPAVAKIKVEEPRPDPEPAKSSEPPPPPPPPPPTPIPLKYYGYTGSPEDARRHGLFLDGEEILVASDGDLVKDRYRIQRIGLTSVEVTDVVQDSTQTLPIVEELGLEGR